MPPTLSPDDLHILMAEADAAARRLLRRLALPRHDLDDLRQQLLTDLIARLPAFDPQRGSLGAFSNVALRHESCRIAMAVARERRLRGATPVSLDEPAPGQEDVTRGELVSDQDGLSAWHGQPVDPVAAAELRIDVEKSLGALARRDGALCAALVERTVDELAANGVGARRTLYRRVREIRMALAAEGLSPAWHGSRAA